MDENLDFNLDEIEDNVEKKAEIKNRYEKLSEKVIFTGKEKDEALAKAQTEADARLKAEKERDFYKDFSQVSTKYKNAGEYQDKILEKVNAGYSVEDATVSVLAKEGKFGVTEQPENPAGGSASTAITETGEKPISEMTQDERRSALLELEKQGVNLLQKQ